MFLHKLYSEPAGLFEAVEFKPGFNFVYAKKGEDGDSRKSLNGLGKSLLLNLIDYCLLSGETSHIKSAKANNDLEEYKIVLEFYVGDDLYVIKRGFQNPNKEIMFGKKTGTLNEYRHTSTDHELSKILCDLIFKNETYEGKYSNTWFRKLMPFFIKAQSSNTKTNFKDPINYLHDRAKEIELIPLHLFLLGISNRLFQKNYEIISEIKAKKPALREVKSLVEDTYNLKDIGQAESELDKLQANISVFEQHIRKFELASQYADVEAQSNKLTEEIKELWHQNFTDRKQIEAYQESFSYDDEDIRPTKIKNLYKELNELLANNIKKTLEEAIKFRKKIAQSRKEFLESEVTELTATISTKEKRISELEKKRAQLFEFLSAKEAIKDLSEAYLDLSKKRERLSDLEGKLKTYQDLSREVTEREKASITLYAEIEQFCIEIKEQLKDFRRIFFFVHDAIYAENKDEANFVFSANKNKDSKVNMDVIIPSNLSYGKNKGRTLIYDLAVLFHAIEKNIHCPRFLIHDGIFDGIDKAHFVHLYNFLMKKEGEGLKFQYIVTLNQEGTIKDLDFGTGAEQLTGGKIEDEAVIVLTPKHPLFGKHWK